MATAGRYTGEQVTELFSFQFFVSSGEIFENQEKNHHSNVTAIVFQLFDFPPVMIISKTFQLASNDRQVHSSCPKTVLRGGKTCLFKIPSSMLKFIGDSSRLKVMLAKVEENSNSPDAIAASEVNLKDFVAALFANEECCVKRRYDIDVFDHSRRPFARLRLKLSLRLVDQLQGEQKPNTSKIERYTVITDPPPLIFTARPPDSSFSGCNGNTSSDSCPLPSQTQTCPPDCSEQLPPGLVCTDKQHFIVWPNGYVEERSKCHSVVRQPPDDKSNDGGYVSEDGYIIGNSKFPLLEALYSELSMMRMRAAGNLINDPSAAFSQKVLLDKCLQTDSQAEAPTRAQVSRKKKEESTKNFTRTCCKQMDNGLLKQPVRHPQVKTSATQGGVEEDTPTVGRDKKTSMTGKATLCSLSVDPPILSGPTSTNPVHSSACTPSLTHHDKSTSPSYLHGTKLSTVDSLNHKSPNMPVHEHPSMDTKIPKTVHSNGQTRKNQPSVMSDPVSCSISTIQGNMVSNETPRRESSTTPTSDSLENSRVANSALGESSPALYSSDFEDEVKTEESRFSPSIDADSLDSSSED